jgi:hypothetical protein
MAADVTSDRSTGQLVTDITSELRTLVRQEVELARTEIRDGLRVRREAVVAATVSGLFALVALGCAVTATAVGLAEVMPRWAAWAIVGGVFLLLAAAALLIARSRARARPLEPEQTRRSIEENVQWARTRRRH